MRRAPLDQRILLPQIEDVVLVDPWRHDQQRPLRHLRGRRLVLDELHQIVLEHDVSRRRRDIDAELEGLAVGHRDSELTVAALDVVEKVVEALDEILPARCDRFAEYLRIGQREIRRRQRVDVLAREEIDLPARVLVEPFDVGDGVVQPARGDEVRLLDVVEEKMFLPVLMPEAFVAFCRLDHGRRGLAHELQHRRLPQR